MTSTNTFLFEVSPIKPDGSITTLNMSSTGSSSKTVYLDNKQWLPLIETPPEFEFSLMNGGQLQYATVSYGDIEFIVSDVYGNEEISAYDWTNVQARCWYGPDGAPFSEFKQVFEGKVSGWRRSGIYAQLALLGSEADIQVPALYNEYDGIGGAEGGEGVKGTLKPRAHGYCINVTPKLIDTVNWVYQVHGYGAVQDIPKVYEFGQSLAPAIGNVANYAALMALDLKPGEWATCLAQGLFRLGGEPSQILTCDVLGGRTGAYASTAKQIIQQLIKEVQPSAQFGPFPACFDVAWNFYGTQATNVWDIVYRAAYEVGGYIFPDGNGVWRAGDFYAPVNRGDLRSDRTTLPLVIDYEEEMTSGPKWKVGVGYDRVYTVHTTDQISPAIFDAEGYAKTEDLEAAKARFEAALSDRTIQQARMAAMAGDGLLTRAEKHYWINKFDKETTDKDQMIGDGSAFDVAAFIANYQNAYNGLAAYLATLSPAFTDGNQDTPVDYPTWAQKWNALWDAKIALASAMVGVADWSKIVGDNKPDDNATVGAPEGTFVAGKPAEAVIDAITAVDGEIIKARQLQADIAAAEQIAADLQTTYGTTVSAAASANAAAQHEANAQTASSNAQTALNDAQAARDVAAGKAQESEAARAAAVAAQTASELARSQSQTFANSSDAA